VADDKYGVSNNNTPHIPYSPAPRYNSSVPIPAGSFGSNSMRSPPHQAPIAHAYTFLAPAHPQRGMSGDSHLFGAHGASSTFDAQSTFGRAHGYVGAGAQRQGPQTTGYRSALLEDFRLNKLGRKWTVGVSADSSIA